MSAAADILIQGRDPVLQLAGPGAAWVNELPVYARRIEANTVGSITTFFKGWAPYGSAEGSAVWMVQRIVLDQTTELDLTDGIAGGVPGEASFAFTWTGRAGHTYS